MIGAQSVEHKTGKRVRIIWWTLFICYLIGISYFLFFSERYGRAGGTNGYRYNLVLFKEIKRFIVYHKEIGFEGFIVNLFGNVIAFMPFGICLPIISKSNRGFFYVLFLSFGFSLAIETIQLLYKIGIFDIDDLLLNTVGGILGYGCYCIVKVISRHGGRKHV